MHQNTVRKVVRYFWIIDRKKKKNKKERKKRQKRKREILKNILVYPATFQETKLNHFKEFTRHQQPSYNKMDCQPDDSRDEWDWEEQERKPRRLNLRKHFSVCHKWVTDLADQKNGLIWLIRNGNGCSIESFKGSREN